MKIEEKTGIADIRGEKESFQVEHYVFKEGDEWGIKAVKLCDGKEKEASSVGKITPLYEKALAMAEKLLEHTVTPVCLKDAIENLIC